MTIRTRLSLWYAGIMFVSLLVMGVLTWRQFAPEPRNQALPTTGQAMGEESDESDLRETLRILLGCGLPAMILAVAGGWWLMRKSLSPIAALTEAAQNIHEKNLRSQLPRTGNGDEFDRLTEVFNGMTARLDGSFQRIREFTLHASHELKTPLTVIHGELETALQNTSLPSAERERLLSHLDETQRLAKIVDGLTLLTKADAGQITLARETVRLDELVRDACADAQILGQPHRVQIRLNECEPSEILGDRHRLRQLLLNLTDNAAKYNQPDGSVEISLRRVNGRAEIAIANTGPGIAPEAQPRLFDRFFRGDSSHNNSQEGCGLGLSIAQWIVSAHGGQIQIQSLPAKITTVTIRLPLCQQAT